MSNYNQMVEKKLDIDQMVEYNLVMEKLLELLDQGEKAITRIVNFLEHHKWNVEGFSDILGRFEFIRGYLFCAEEHDIGCFGSQADERHMSE